MKRPSPLVDAKPSCVKSAVPHHRLHWPPGGSTRVDDTMAPTGVISSRKTGQPADVGLVTHV